MTEIGTHNLESNFTPYTVTLHSERAEVCVVKTRHGGHTYTQTIKHGSSTFKRVLRDMRRQAEPGSLLAEQMQQCADTCL